MFFLKLKLIRKTTTKNTYYCDGAHGSRRVPVLYIVLWCVVIFARYDSVQSSFILYFAVLLWPYTRVCSNNLLALLLCSSVGQKIRTIVNFISLTAVDYRSRKNFIQSVWWWPCKHIVADQNFVIFSFLPIFFLSGGKSIFEDIVADEVFQLNSNRLQTFKADLGLYRLRFLHALKISCTYSWKFHFTFSDSGVTQKVGGQFKNSILCIWRNIIT